MRPLGVGILCLALTACASRQLNVLVYNMHAGADAAGAPNLDRVAAIVRETRADVVLLQEVDKGVRRSRGVDQPAELARLTGFHVAFGRTLDFQGGQYGLAILSRWPISGDTLIPLTVTTAPERSGRAYEPRGALRARLASPFGDLVAVNTHLDASRDHAWRVQEVSTVLALSRDATLVGGDFNSEPGSPVQDSVRLAGLRDAWPLCGQGPGLTFPADSSVKRIDYLFLRPGATCTEARVIPTRASDHRPLFVRVKIKT
jgi:endonuclease/exonuclease/phosphatase family metal-dependent hydrolase